MIVKNRKKINLIILLLIFSIAFFWIANDFIEAKVTYNQFKDTTGIPGAPASTAQELVDVVQTILEYTYWLTLTLAVLFIIFAAFTYLTAAGDVEKVKKARLQLIYAVIAIAITLIAIGATAIVGDLLDNGTGGAPSGVPDPQKGGWKFWIKYPSPTP